MHVYRVVISSFRTGDDNGDGVQKVKAGGPFNIWVRFVVRLLGVVLVGEGA